MEALEHDWAEPMAQAYHAQDLRWLGAFEASMCHSKQCSSSFAVELNITLRTKEKPLSMAKISEYRK
jgi:hypothetical protein